MEALKGLVVGLGMLIIAGFVLLGYGFYVRITDPDFQVADDDEKSAVRADADGPPSDLAMRSTAMTRDPFGTISVPLPADCTVVEMRPHGDRLYLRTGPEGLCERVLVVDATSGQLLGTLILKP